MRFVIALTATFLSGQTALAECSAPRWIDKDLASTYDYKGQMFASQRTGPPREYHSWPVSRVAHLRNNGCYRSDAILSENGTVGSNVAINNHLPSLDDVSTVAVRAKTKHDLSVVQIRLSPKKEAGAGTFSVRLARSSQDRGCTWYRNGKPEAMDYQAGKNFEIDVRSIRRWNDAHTPDTDHESADRTTAGRFHAAAGPTNPSTFDRRNVEKYRFAQELTNDFDVLVSIRLICFSQAENSYAGMLPLEVISGDAGVIVSYFSASAELSSTVRICSAPFCNKIENLRVGSPYSGLIAWLLGRG